MTKDIEIIQNSDELTKYDKYYWGYQYRLAKEVLVPQLIRDGLFHEGDVVAEIGCAEGGVLAAFVQAGAKDAFGTDISQSRLEKGKIISNLISTPIEFNYHDIMNEPIKEEWKEKCDLVLLRDVIEHLDDTKLALSQIKQIIKPGGFLFVTFPPYHSPFGGHQQTLMNFSGKIPYIHLLPNFIFHRLIASGRINDQGEVKRLQTIRMTPKKFMEAAQATGYKIHRQNYYLLRPVFKMKFGLPAIKLYGISKIPFVRKYFSLEAQYVLRSEI